MIRALAIVLLATLGLSAQTSTLFPRFSVTAGMSAADFETNARIDPDDGSGTGTLVSFERDLGLDDTRTVPRLGLQWRPFAPYWARRTERDGVGITLGLARIGLDASVTAVTIAGSETVTQRANTDVPVALAGVQGRVAFTPRIHGEASIATLPRVTIEDYTGSALIGGARLEVRPVPWLGIGAAYDYFRMDIDVARADLRGALKMTIRGPSAFVRLAF